jgi:hypothetical protein
VDLKMGRGGELWKWVEKWWAKLQERNFVITSISNA